MARANGTASHHGAGVRLTRTAEVTTAAMLSYQFNLNMWVGVFLAMILSLFIGFINGFLVVRTGIPSFLITLGTFFVLLKLGVIVHEASRPAIQDYGNYSLDQGREVRPEEERR